MSSPKCSLLVVDDEPFVLAPLSALLASDFDVHVANSAEAAQTILRQRHFDIILTDQTMPRMTGVQLLEWVRTHSPRTVRLLMTGFTEHEDAVQAINRGQVYYYLSKPWRTEELLQILRNAAEKYRLERSQEELLDKLQQLNLLLEQRIEDRTRELAETNQKLAQRNLDLEKLALTDPLTGLLNRRAIDDVARAEIRRRARYDSPLAIGVIDVDHFKHINDSHLLPGGDFVLIQLAQTFTSLLRTVDSIGRIGGEEFLIVAPETTLDGAAGLAERIRTTVQDTPFVYRGSRIPVTISLGVAVAETGTLAAFEDMKDLASAAMRQAKGNGRNNAVIRAIPETPSVRDTAAFRVE